MPKKRRTVRKKAARTRNKKKEERKAEKQLEAELGKLPGAPTPAK